MSLEFFHHVLNQHLSFRRTFQLKNVENGSLRRNPDNPKMPKKLKNNLTYLYLNSHFSITLDFTSIKVLIDGFSSVERSSNWNSLIFAESTELS